MLDIEDGSAGLEIIVVLLDPGVLVEEADDLDAAVVRAYRGPITVPEAAWSVAADLAAEEISTFSGGPMPGLPLISVSKRTRTYRRTIPRLPHHLLDRV